MTSIVTELQRIPTSGARAVEAFTVDGLELIAIPQLATDVPEGPIGMNAGNSNTEMLILRRDEGRYVPFAALAAPGGEDAEFFRIGGRAFLAVASIRSGSGPYQYTCTSTIYEWRAGAFVEFQTMPTYAAKQWKHWRIGDRDFLGLAQGLDLPHIEGPNRNSMVYEWQGDSFVEFQVIPSAWAYNWHPFEIDGQFFVAHADHLVPSTLYRWDGQRLVAHQPLLERGGRAFAHFKADDGDYLVVAGIDSPPTLTRWADGAFAAVQTLPGLGARELRIVEHGGRLFLIRINFILGSPQDPDPSLTSDIFEWLDGTLVAVAEFPTSGGTDVEVVACGAGVEFLVTNSLSPRITFATESVLYELSTGGPA